MLAELTGTGKIKHIYVKKEVFTRRPKAGVVKRGGAIALGVGGATTGGAKRRGRPKRKGGAVTAAGLKVKKPRGVYPSPSGQRKTAVRRGRGLTGLSGLLGGAKPRKTKARKPRKGGAMKGVSNWVSFVKRVASEKGIPYGQAMKVASSMYK